ncbi:MAG: AGE family epimerase/isomerase, partial [Peptostreptococcaceae bacterium]|nr:AGE family epimerase/isomerase [Peptostreptococcaceae bacterium]
MKIEKLNLWKKELENHLHNELLPFWLDRVWDNDNGGFVTQFDKDGNLTDCDEKSMLAHMRTIFSLSIAYEDGHDLDGRCEKLARKGVDFAIDVYWDKVYGGFYWLLDRKNNVICNEKILYGQSFAIYALSTFAKIFNDQRALYYAEKCFDLLQIYCTETTYGGYWEMFERDWTLKGPGSKGGDRKTLDFHMHLMEAFTSLFIASGKDIHRRKLLEVIDLLLNTILDKKTRTGTPQFYKDWSKAPQIKFDIIWGWDRFDTESGAKPHTDNTSYAHNVEFFWLLMDALKALNINPAKYNSTFKTILNHALRNGVDWTYGGIYTEGSSSENVTYDYTKEFWQQAEFMIGMLEAYL